jgi:hypothetical protein
MISSLFSSFGRGTSGSGLPAPQAAQNPQAAKPVQLENVAPHVAATFNASVACNTIEAILESAQAQKAALTARSGFTAENDPKTMNRKISRVADKYDEVAEEDDYEIETYRTRSGR